jgi:hypothetical protein
MADKRRGLPTCSNGVVEIVCRCSAAALERTTQGRRRYCLAETGRVERILVDHVSRFYLSRESFVGAFLSHGKLINSLNDEPKWVQTGYVLTQTFPKTGRSWASRTPARGPGAHEGYDRRTGSTAESSATAEPMIIPMSFKIYFHARSCLKKSLFPDR